MSATAFSLAYDLAPSAPADPVPTSDPLAPATAPDHIVRVNETQRNVATPANDPAMLDRPVGTDAGNPARFDFAWANPVDYWPERAAPSIPTIIDLSPAGDQIFEQGGAIPNRRAPTPQAGPWDGAWTI